MLRIKEINVTDAQVCFLLDSESLQLWSYEQWKSQLNRKHVKTLAIYRFKKLVGVCVFELIIDEAELHYIAIHPEFTRKGFGKMLFVDFLKRIEENNIKKIFLEVSSKNLSAINFYESFNFKTERIRKKYYKDGTDAILKTKIIC